VSQAVPDYARRETITVQAISPSGGPYEQVQPDEVEIVGPVGASQPAHRSLLGTPAELRLIDEVAPAMMASWYLRSFSCEKSPLCDPKADEMMETARNTLSPQTRAQALAAADQQLEQDAFFIPIAAPVRWSLISPRLNGFRPNAFGRHALDELIAGNGAGGSGESGY